MAPHNKILSYYFYVVQFQTNGMGTDDLTYFDEVKAIA
jgi:hypothetical protein